MGIDIPEFGEWTEASKHDAELRRQMYAERYGEDDDDEFDEPAGPPPNTIVREKQKIGRNDPSGDFNCDGIVTAVDLAIAWSHLGHMSDLITTVTAASWGRLKIVYR